MPRRKIFIFLLIAMFSVSFYGCEKVFSWLGLGKKKEEPKTQEPRVTGTVIAKVNNLPITLEELNQEIEAYNSLVPEDRPEERIDTVEKKIAYLKNELVRRRLLYQEALDRGLEKKEDYQKAMENLKMSLLVSELVKEEVQNVDVTAKEIEGYYNQYKDTLKEPEERRIREIVSASEDEAKAVLIELLRGADFATLAKERSKSASAAAGGNLGFLKKGDKPGIFDDVAFSATLEVGKISSIFKGPDGYYILKLEEKREGHQRSLSEMWDDIKKGLEFIKQQQKLEDLIAKLSKEAKIEVYEGLVK
jgi:peptidyl-prolyl cis-trans isomerase C